MKKSPCLQRPQEACFSELSQVDHQVRLGVRPSSATSGTLGSMFQALAVDLLAAAAAASATSADMLGQGLRCMNLSARKPS